ncbi:MAG TPA: protein translocase subunit SecF [Xanthomonadaceae bacterium]|nr:protein translocase subunit SecF [Xanthomonadaceae bacterium]
MKPLNLFPYDSAIPFMRMRWGALVLAAILVLTAIAAMATRGFNFALDFTGGTVTELRFEQPVDVDDIRSRLESAGYDSPQVQTLGSGNDLLVRLQPKQGDDPAAANRTADDVVDAVSVPGNPATVVKSDFVGPQVGDELALNGVYALLFVGLGFLVYISFRFEWKFAVAAIACTAQDITIVLGWFALTQREFDLTVLAGVLSVMGYSINDTIVVFDRVRENFRSMRLPAAEILNKAINQTLSRTMITSFVSFLTVLALFLYGGGSLRGMAEAMMVGIVIGTISTTFVACPILLWLGVNKQDLMPKSRDEAALARRP